MNEKLVDCVMQTYHLQSVVKWSGSQLKSLVPACASSCSLDAYPRVMKRGARLGTDKSSFLYPINKGPRRERTRSLVRAVCL